MSCSVDKTEIPATWYSGYKMPQLLEKNIEAKSIDDIKLLVNSKWYTEFTIVNPAAPDTKYTVNTCSSIPDGNIQKLYTIPERSNSAFMDITAMCQATSYILKGKASTQTFLNNLVFDKSLPDKLPKRIAMVTSVTEYRKLFNDKNIKYWSQVLEITGIDINGAGHATYQTNGGAQELELVAKGDFNGDKIEDILLTSRDSVEDGSYSATRLFMFTKLSNDGDIIFLQ